MKKLSLRQKRYTLSKPLLYIIVPLFSLLLMSSGGGGGKNSGGKNDNYRSNTCPVKTATLVLHEGNLNAYNVPSRSYTYPSFQPVSNILNGGQAKSTSNLFYDKHLNYCSITITATNCSNYGNGGTKVYLWDSSNDGDDYDNRMNIEIPDDGSFTLTVKLYEGCGPWYVNNTYKRAVWRHQGNYYPTDIISVETWWVSRVDSC